MITLARVAELLDLDSSTGVLTRKARTFYDARTASVFTTRFAGKPTGALDRSTGYLIVQLDGKSYYAHRLVWALHYGEWPKYQIDHIDGNRTNNRIENLRDVVQAENTRNKGISRINTSGCVGVSWDKRKQKWRAFIGMNRKQIFCGYFEDKDSAIKARKLKERELGFSENHGTPRARGLG